MTDHMQLQRKTVGQSSDTPTSVISSPATSSTITTLQPTPEPPAQAEPKAESAEPAPEQERQPSLLNHDFGRIPILPKLSVSQPNDPYEQEADRVAAQVMRMPDRTSAPTSSVQGFVGHDFGQIALSSGLQPAIQRKCAVCEAEEKLSRKENGDAISNVGGLENKLAESQGGGEPLSEDIRGFMEPRFGFDFSHIRIHTDASAVEMNKSINAQAFTHRNNIYFNAGKYAPETQEGKQLLAHELTHTVQQTGGETFSNTNHAQTEESIQNNELIQAKAISKAPFPLISLKVIPSVGASTPPPAPQLDTSSSEGLLQSLSTTPASSLSQAVNQAKGATGQVQSQEKQKLETNLPEQESSTGLPRRSSRPQAKATTLEPGEAPAPKLASGQAKKKFEIKHKAAEGAVPGSNVSTEASVPNDLGGWLSWLTGRISSFLKDIPTKDPGLNTSAGERPTVDLEGEADPNQNDQHQRESEQEVKARQLKADQAAAENFGENDIYPTIPTERLRSSHRLSSPRGVEGRGQHPPHLPADIRAEFDENETPSLSPKLQYQLRNYQAEEVKHQRESQQIRQEGQNRIDQETGRVRDQQTGLQHQTQTAVNDERQRWREENQSIQEEYNNQAQTKRRDLDQQVQRQVETTDQETDRRLTEAEQRAESERQRTEREAEDKKREFENKPQSFWEQAKDAISSFFEGLRQGIERLFEGLRRLVQQIIEAAKTVVRTLIEAARQVIVALIRGFGEVLKGLVTVALFAFPETAARAREWIDGRVNTAVKQVNEAAERLTQFTDAALDWIGQRLDDALNLLQGAFNVALDVAEFLATAPLEIMNQLAQIMGWLQENGGLIGGIQRLEQSAADVAAGAKETLTNYINKVPEELNQQLDEASQQVNLEAIRPHWDGILHYVQQDLENLKNSWWDAIKEMLWTWIWPFHENSPVLKNWPIFTQELENCFNHIGAGEYSKAIDSFLKATQLFTEILDAFSLWFTIAAVIIGAVVGSIVPGAGTLAGAKIGLEVAGVFGTVLSVVSFVAEAGILGKAIYDLTTGENTEAENDEDYQAIASSGMAVALEAIFSLLGFAIGAAAASTIGTKIGHSIAKAIHKMLRNIPYKPRPRRVPDLPNGRPDPGGDGGSPSGTDADTPDPGRADEPPTPTDEPDVPETPGRTPEEPTSPEPDTPDPTRTPEQPTGDGTDPTSPDPTPNRPEGDSPQPTQSPDADTRPADQPSNDSLTEEQLTEGLPPDLQGQVPVRVNPELPGNTVRVYYTRNGDGTVGDIRIEAGPDAQRVDIELHAETARLMQRYSGLSGRIRILKERIENWITRNGEPPVGSRAWEAQLEIEKLPRIIDERLERLSRGGLDAQAEADLRADIENLEQQLDQHQRTLDEMDTDPGVGFVAAESRNSSSGDSRETSSAEDSLPDASSPDATTPVGRDTSSRTDQTDGGSSTPENTPPWTSPLARTAPERYEEMVRRRGTDSRTLDEKPLGWTGSKEAEFRGYPEAEEGYRWVLDQNGTLRYDRDPVLRPDGTKRPRRTYNEDTGKFEDVQVIPAKYKSGDPETWKIPREKKPEYDELLRGREEGRFLRDDLLDGNTNIGKWREAAEKWGQELKNRRQELQQRRELELTPEQKEELQDELDDIEAELEEIEWDERVLERTLSDINEQSRRLGEKAAENYVSSKYPNATRVYGGPNASSKSGDFDQIWKVPGEGPDSKDLWIVIEAKGGSSPLGERNVQGGQAVAEQGSKAYFDEIVRQMSNTTAGQELKTAIGNGADVQYLEVRAPIKINNKGEPELQDIKIREFDISE